MQCCFKRLYKSKEANWYKYKTECVVSTWFDWACFGEDFDTLHTWLLESKTPVNY